MLAKIIRHLRKGKAKDKAQVLESGYKASVWRGTGKVYYLEDTLKLTYQSNSGPISIEKLSVGKLSEVLQQLTQLSENSPLAQSRTASQKDAFCVRLCGVTWQQNGDSVRIKAIPQAALLRSRTQCFSRSQAVFRHAFLLEHDDLLSPTLSHNKAGVFTYNRISIQEFTQQIMTVNARLAAPLRRAISVKAENFDTAFTAHEKQQIDSLIGCVDGQEKLENT